MQKNRLNARSQKGATEIAQFPLTIYFMFLVVLLPVLNLVNFLVAGTTAYLATNDLAAKAATQATFSQALNAMAIEAYNFQSNSLAQFVKMSPQGGYAGCGNDLFVLATNIGGAGVQSSAPDQSLNSNIDTSKYIYEMQVVSSYTVSPLVSLASLPILGSIPGLGQPVKLSFAASRPIEHPGGMETATNNGGGAGGVTAFSRIAASVPGVPPPATSATWRTPGIFQQIQAAGQTVVSVNVVDVQANYGPVLGAQNGGWASTGITVQPGQNVWLDTQAVGTWGWTGMTLDANGTSTGNITNGPKIDADLPNLMLIGYVGSAPILPYGHGGVAISGDPHFIPSGDTLLNFPLNFSGPLSLACNDNQNYISANIPDVGSQQVRIIITR